MNKKERQLPKFASNWRQVYAINNNKKNTNEYKKRNNLKHKTDIHLFEKTYLE